MGNREILHILGNTISQLQRSVNYELFQGLNDDNKRFDFNNVLIHDISIIEQIVLFSSASSSFNVANL